MKRAIVLLFVLMFTVTGVAFAGADQTATRAEFEELCRSIEGRWVGDIVWNAAWKGYGKKAGDKATGYYVGKMTADGNALIGVFYAGTGTSTSFYHYDAGAKQIRSAGVDSGGGAASGVFYKGKGKWHISSIGSLPDGTKTEAEATLVLSDDGNTMTLSRSTAIAGKKSTSKDVWRRVSK